MIRSALHSLRIERISSCALKRFFSAAININNDLVQFTHDPSTKIGTITLQSSTRHNPLTVEMGAQFQATVQSINASMSNKELNINSIILHGANSTFSAGGDINWLRDLRKNPVHVNADLMLHFYKSFLSVRELQVPVITAIDGYAVGAGACLAIATDVRVMAKDAKIGFNFVKLGIHAGMGGSHFLPIAVGEGKAMEIMLMGKTLDGEEAGRLGVAQMVVDGNGEDLLDEARKVAARIGKMHPLAVRSMVQTMRLRQDSMGSGLEAALQRESHAQALCYAREDWGEGLDAVTQRREPSFDDYHSDCLS